MYIDSSALLKLYFVEPGSSDVPRLLDADPNPVTSRLTRIEVRRNLAVRLDGSRLESVRAEFERDWSNLTVIELDEVVCERAAALGASTGIRSVDALHLSAAEQVGSELLTYDRRQAAAARSLGWSVVGIEE